MKDISLFSDGTFAVLGTSVPTQKRLSPISSCPGGWVRLPQGATSEGGTRISTLSTPRALILLFPVNCSEVRFFQSNSVLKSFLLLSTLDAQ